MFGTIKALAKRVARLETDLSTARVDKWDKLRHLSNAVAELKGNHLLYGVPIHDENGETGVATVLDVREVVRALAEINEVDICVQKKVDSHVVLLERL